MFDIDLIKNEMLEQENRELRAQVEGSQRQETSVKLRKKRIGFHFDKRVMRKTAEQA